MERRQSPDTEVGWLDFRQSRKIAEIAHQGLLKFLETDKKYLRLDSLISCLWLTNGLVAISAWDLSRQLINSLLAN